jgi:hypothetical protein
MFLSELVPLVLWLDVISTPQSELLQFRELLAECDHATSFRRTGDLRLAAQQADCFRDLTIECLYIFVVLRHRVLLLRVEMTRRNASILR